MFGSSLVVAVVALSPSAALQGDLQAIVDAAPARVGVYAKNLVTGDQVGVSADDAFPMQSVFKLPVAIALLRAVEMGELQLRDVMSLRSADVRAGAATGLGARIGTAGLAVSLGELLKTMVIDSDNTAVDALLSRIGGSRGVTQSLRALGVTGVRVDRGERELHCDNAGIAPSDCAGFTPAALETRIRGLSLAARRRAAEAYLSDERDTATPRAMGQLLEALHAGRLLSPANTALLEHLLEEVNTGAARLRAGLPDGTRLLHKTGTGRAVGNLLPVVNDVGVILSPTHGAFAVSVFVCDGIGESVDIEAVIAEVAQAVWAHWAVGAGETRTLALTLDDGPQLEDTPRMSPEGRNQALLKALHDAKLQAALFVTTSRGADRPRGFALLREWSAAGHRIGNHTVTHPSIDKGPLTDFEKEVLDCDLVIDKLPGFFPRFRFPFLKEGKTEAVRDGFRHFLAAHNYNVAEVSIDASDWYYDQRLVGRLREDATADVDDYRRAYVAHLLDRAQYYDNLARRVLGRSPAHVLLTHHSLLNALFLPEVIAAFTAHGWTWVSPETAYADPMYAMRPTILPAGESLVWSLARDNGVSGLREPGEDSIYEAAKLDALGL